MKEVFIDSWINTPRFLKVQIIAIFKNKEDARKLGFVEPTHYDGEFDVLGRHIGTNMMDFAVVFKKSS